MLGLYLFLFLIWTIFNVTNMSFCMFYVSGQIVSSWWEKYHVLERTAQSASAFFDPSIWGKVIYLAVIFIPFSIL